ncbi:MAG: type I DNA topoisomerase [bacterium]
MVEKKKPIVIVESNAKVKTINKILGDGFIVASCQGHLYDLPESGLGVNVENGFEPKYQMIEKKSKIIEEIKKLWKKASVVYLASDPDREGEAIAYQLLENIGRSSGNVKKVKRITFNEITKTAVLSAIEKPREIDENLVKAQKARRILDRLVGYRISPMLWKHVTYRLSAGRVQTVALRLICERENEVREFIPQYYYSIDAQLGKGREEFTAELVIYKGEKIGSPNDKNVHIIETKEEADRKINELRRCEFKVLSVKVKEEQRHPPKPFITSTLQQSANNILGFSSKKTMSVAQRLYEGKDIGGGDRVGLITYMRTDSPRIAEGAITELRDYIIKDYGEKYLSDEVRRYKAGGKAQDAHEAIRPTSVLRRPEDLRNYLDKDEFALYKLIWQRFTATQMSPARVERTTVEIGAGDGIFRANGSKLLFDGFLKVMPESKGEEKKLPSLSEGEILNLISIESKEHSTQPPPRYTEASLVMTMQDLGIGRPSTYAPTISLLLDRKYVVKEGRSLIPTDMGELVADTLVKSFEDIFRVEYTAKMEEGLDRVEEGSENWQELLSKFYDELCFYLKSADKKMESARKDKESLTELMCEKCGKPMMIKYGKGGKFLGCSGYPDCKNTKPFKIVEGRIVLLEDEYKDEICEKCGATMVVKGGRFGPFLACSRYPECKNARGLNSNTGILCPKEGCNGLIVMKKSKKGRSFYGCSRYPECDFIISQRPVAIKCPKCHANFLVLKGRGENKRTVCITEGCGYEIEYDGE